MGARYPEKDPEYNEELGRKHLERVRRELMSRLEKRRLEYLSEDYAPGNNCWGIKIINNE